MSRPAAAVALLGLALALVLPAHAAADPYLPPAGKVWNGLTAGFDASDFERRAGKHPAIWQHFVAWGGSYQFTLDNSRRARARLMYHLSTSKGQNLPERYSPGEIARGAGDGWLVALTRDIAAAGAPAYMRPFGEMNNCNNPYAAYSCGGGRRDADHAAKTLIKAWKRVHVIMHGGDVAAMDARLERLRLPAVRTSAAAIPTARIAFVWAPMTGGAPNISALRPQVYWPGRRWVDWVGTSFYSRFPNFSGLERFYTDFAIRRNKPFAIAEWAIWGADAPAFADRLFDWIGSHRRTRMVQYNQGSQPGGIFRLSRYPASARVVKRRLAASRYVGFAPEQR